MLTTIETLFEQIRKIAKQKRQNNTLFEQIRKNSGSQ